VDLDAVADELYGLVPAEFTAARNARAAAAKKAGDRELAAAIGKLRRPTKSAWLANRLVRDRKDEVVELLALGGVMRDAHEQLAGDDLRDLSRRRRDLVTALAREGAELATRAGETVTSEMARDLEATLEAGVADAAAGEAVRAGRLTDALSYSGFGLAGLAPGPAGPERLDRPAPTAARAAPAPRDRAVPAAPGQAAGGAATAESAAQEALEGAEREAGEARRAAVTAAERAAASVEADATLKARIGALEAELAELRHEVGAVARAMREARRERDVADHAAAAADARLARAREKVARSASGRS
jgi:hypothetical protein